MAKACVALAVQELGSPQRASQWGVNNGANKFKLGDGMLARLSRSRLPKDSMVMWV